MMRSYMKRKIEGIETHYGYDASYMHEIVETDASAGFKLMLALGFLNHDFGLPAEIAFAAGVRSTMRADCGPCLKLGVDKAREAGIAPERLLPALGHGEADADTALVVAFADAVVDNAPELVELAAAVRERFGASGHVGLAVAVLAGQFYPMLKRGLGHGAACAPVVRTLLEEAGRTMELKADDDSDRRRQAEGVS